MTPDSRAERPSWTSLTSHSTNIKALHLRDLFDQDSSRGERFHLETEGFYFDYAKQLLTEETLRLLLDLAR
jgi:glucose-6-phosphate isomerase